MRRWKYIVVAALVAGVAIAGYFAHVTRTASLSDEEWDICEAVLRHQIFHSAAGGRGTATAYVEVQARNPTGAFLDRFQGHEPPVKARWRFSLGAGFCTTSTASSERGRIRPRWTGATTRGASAPLGTPTTSFARTASGSWNVTRCTGSAERRTRDCRGL
jgi:hypothetical protein